MLLIDSVLISSWYTYEAVVIEIESLLDSQFLGDATHNGSTIVKHEWARVGMDKAYL